MTIPQLIENHTGTGFSFEVLPPLKGKGISQLFKNIDSLKEFNPLYINITTHRSELVYKSTPDGLYQKVTERSRPGTVAVAAAIQQRYNIPAVPHIICSGYSKIETEYALIDLNFLGITNLLLLRGDKAKHESRFIPNENGHSHASELQLQVNDFNKGLFLDGTKMDIITGEQFSYGVAGYPEKHEEAMNMDMDIECLKAKIKAGAKYVVTQMFFDNQVYYDFVEKCRKAGIDVPIIPGLKPLSSYKQLTSLPEAFSLDIPVDLTKAIEEVKDDKAAIYQIGTEWCAMQCKDLIRHGVPAVHFYTMGKSENIVNILKECF